MSRSPAWLNEAPLQELFAGIRAAGGEARAVGGCVRDFLMLIEGGDIDIATTLTPQQVSEAATRLGFKTVPTGIDHGTVTVVLPNRAVEVTTLRRDVATDGRRATIAYTDDWREDAARRDFTINALYMDAAGNLYDYFRGQRDLTYHRILFIGDATSRIREDGLRILRYFRFLATHGKPPADGEALAAIAQEKEMILKLSGERIANEMRKLLSAENPAYSLRLMAEQGVAALVFGGNIDPTRMIRLHLLENKSDYQCSVWARTAMLLGSHLQNLRWVTTRWKLARHEIKQLLLMAELPPFTPEMPRHAHTRLIRLHGTPAYLDWLLIQAAIMPGLDIAPYVKLAHQFTPPTFPVTAKDVMDQLGMSEGKALGERLAMLEQRWEESDYTLSKAELLRFTPQ